MEILAKLVAPLIVYFTVGVIVGIVSVVQLFTEDNKYVRDKLDVTFWVALLASFIYHVVCWPIVIVK